MKIKSTFIVILFFLTSLIFSSNYKLIKETSTIKFDVNHFLFLQAKGTFENYDGTIYWNKQNISKCNFSGKIYVKSIQTGKKKYNDILLTPSFLNEKVFPEIIFSSKKIEFISPTVYKVTGLLTVKNITHEISGLLLVEDILINQKNYLKLSTRLVIDRTKFNIATQYKWPLLHNDVKITMSFLLKPTNSNSRV